MSLDALIWAVKDAPLADCEEHAVLSVMADEADEAGCGVFLSIPTISERSKVSAREVSRCIGAMIERGLLGLGDQSLASYIRADRRPVVYDLLIPYSWYGKIDRVNRNRVQKNLPELTPENRPDIPEAPPKRRRADYGKKRVGSPKAAGVTNSRSAMSDAPVTDSYGTQPDGVTASPLVDGVTSSPGGLAVTYPQTAKSLPTDWQSSDPVSNPVKEPIGGTLPPNPLRPQAPPSSALGNDNPDETCDPDSPPGDVIGNHRPRARRKPEQPRQQRGAELFDEAGVGVG